MVPDIAILPKKNYQAVKFTDYIQCIDPCIQNQALDIYIAAEEAGLVCPYIDDCLFGLLEFTYHENGKYIRFRLTYIDFPIIHYKTSMSARELEVERSPEQLPRLLRVLANYVLLGDSL